LYLIILIAIRLIFMCAVFFSLSVIWTYIRCNSYVLKNCSSSVLISVVIIVYSTSSNFFTESWDTKFNVALKSISAHSDFQLSNICSFIIVIKCLNVSFMSFQLSSTEAMSTDLSLLSASKVDLNLRNNKALYDSSFHNCNR